MLGRSFKFPKCQKHDIIDSVLTCSNLCHFTCPEQIKKACTDYWDIIIPVKTDTGAVYQVSSHNLKKILADRWSCIWRAHDGLSDINNVIWL